MESPHAVLAALALLLAGLAGAWFGGRPLEPVPVVPVSAGAMPEARAEVLTVHVSGAVAAPGLVQLPAGGRVGDAVAAAGGALASADLTGINLAARVGDGEQVVVPLRGDRGANPRSPDGRIRINTASAVELEVLPGVGPVLAARIVEHRERNGPFRVVEDLLDVPGIGETRLADLRERVVVP